MGLKVCRLLTNSLAIICILLGAGLAVSLAVVIGVYVFFAEDGGLSVSMLELVGLTDLLGFLSSLVNLALFAALLACGVSGVRAARRPSKARELHRLAIVLTMVSAARTLIDLFSLVSEPSSMSILSSVACALAGAAMCALSRRLTQLDAERIAQGLPEEDPLSSTKYLGILRLIEVMFIVNIAFTLTCLIFESRDAVVYDFSNLLDWVNVVFECLALWMIFRRFAAARPFVLAYTAFNMGSGIVYGLATNTLEIQEQLLSSLFDIFLFLYFLLSRRVRLICTRHFSFAPVQDDYRPSRGILDLKREGWPMLRDLIMYYCVFSLMGHWMEAAMCQLIRLGLVDGDYDPSNTMLWRDWFYPFPMEGLAVVLIALFLTPLKDWLVQRIENRVVPYVVSFFANMMTCVSIEFFMGLAVNANHQLWNYTNIPFNFMGQVCLQNSLAFGVAASIIAWLVFPLIDRAVSRVPNDAMNIAFVVCVAAYAIPQTLYLIDPPLAVEEAVDESAATLIEDATAGSA